MWEAFKVFKKCLRSHWCVHVFVDYADTVSAQLLTMPTPCPRGQQLCQHRVSVVIDYTESLTWCLRSRWLRWHCVGIVIDHADTVWRSQQLSRHRFVANIFVIMKEFAKPFLPVHMGPRSILSKTNFQKSRDTVPLRSFLTVLNLHVCVTSQF